MPNEEGSAVAHLKDAARHYLDAIERVFGAGHERTVASNDHVTETLQAANDAGAGDASAEAEGPAGPQPDPEPDSSHKVGEGEEEAGEEGQKTA